jgi:Ca2+-binding EF-hand superfamily protein
MTSISGTSAASASALRQLIQLMQQQKAAKANANETAKTDFTTANSSVTPAAQGLSSANDVATIFKDADTDGDGSVSKEEFSALFQQLQTLSKSALLSAQEQQSTVNSIFSKVDSDGSGGISLAELASAAPDVPKGPPPGGPPPRGDGIADLLSSLDTDGDGSVSKSELEAAFKNAGAADNTKADDIFAKLDADGNGQVTQSEIASAAPKGHHHHHGGPPPVDTSDASSDDTTSLFKSLDTNSDGSVSKDELQAMMDKIKSFTALLTSQESAKASTSAFATA